MTADCPRSPRYPSPTPPATDDQVSAYRRALGIPEIVDLHTHFMPYRVLRKVWDYFDTASDRLGFPWPIHYRTAEEDRVARLRAMDVGRWTALVYPHKADMAEWLTDWALEFAARHPDCVPGGTFYPEPDADTQVERALGRGARIFKAHLQVGSYDPRDPRLDPVWGRLAEARTPVVCHCGHGPETGEATGVGPITEVLRRHPDLVLVVAHLGMPDYTAFLDLAERHPSLMFDTTMVFTDFTERIAPFPPRERARLAELGERIVLGTDFPNIPYSYAHQLSALHRLDLGEDWLRGVLYENGTRLLDQAEAAALRPTPVPSRAGSTGGAGSTGDAGDTGGTDGAGTTGGTGRTGSNGGTEMSGTRTDGRGGGR
ncbi:amidohydrolase family protein [Streptomyces sp. AJS327]|uniref:amidohydrolase family protein n=1 Tax=Streptomyces sp. AJS327 TaxID=2545265 RepID=UPI0027E4048C|nr:amidohydrolase family protein [Streptomyces sp. AJS327]